MNKLLLFIIPILLLCNVIFSSHQPFWNGRYDPAYAYLMNGLNLAGTYGNIGHYDHPGTPVQVIIACILKITYITRNTQNDLAADVLTYPEYYLRVIALTFSFFNCLLLLALGWVVFRLTGNLFYGLLFESIPVLSRNLFYSFFYGVRPEIVICGTVILFIIVYFITLKSDKLSGTIKLAGLGIGKTTRFEIPWSLVLISLITGFCLATKINSAPLMLFPIVVIPRIRDKCLYILFAVIAFIIFTLPIVQYYPLFGEWLFRIFIHTSHYGSGGKGVVNFTDFADNIWKIILAEPIYTTIIFISLVAVVTGLVKKNASLRNKVLQGIVLVQVCGIFITAKHFALRYLIPFIPTIMVNVFILISYFTTTKLQKGLIILLFILLCFKLNFHIFRTKFIPAERPQIDCQAIYFYGANSPIYALQLGNYHSRSLSSPILRKIYGDQYYYLPWNHEFHSWEKKVNLDDLTRLNKKLILYGSEALLKRAPPKFPVRQLNEHEFLIMEQRTHLTKISLCNFVITFFLYF